MDTFSIGTDSTLVEGAWKTHNYDLAKKIFTALAPVLQEEGMEVVIYSRRNGMVLTTSHLSVLTEANREDTADRRARKDIMTSLSMNTPVIKVWFTELDAYELPESFIINHNKTDYKVYCEGYGICEIEGKTYHQVKIEAIAQP